MCINGIDQCYKNMYRVLTLFIVKSLSMNKERDGGEGWGWGVAAGWGFSFCKSLQCNPNEVYETF